MSAEKLILSVEYRSDVSRASQCSGGCGQACSSSSGGGNCAQSTGHSQKARPSHCSDACGTACGTCGPDPE